MRAEDIAYIREQFIPLKELCSERGHAYSDVLALIERECLPRPTYLLPDGTAMVPYDYFELLEDAGDPARLQPRFEERWERALAELAPPGFDRRDLPVVEEEWTDYISGLYGVCLREVTPERMAEKTLLCFVIEELLAEPQPDDAGWRAGLRTAVDRLDEIEMPFSEFDRERLGGPVSRDRLITAVRERYAEIFKPSRAGDRAAS